MIAGESGYTNNAPILPGIKNSGSKLTISTKFAKSVFTPKLTKYLFNKIVLDSKGNQFSNF